MEQTKKLWLVCEKTVKKYSDGSGLPNSELFYFVNLDAEEYLKGYDSTRVGFIIPSYK